MRDDEGKMASVKVKAKCEQWKKLFTYFKTAFSHQGFNESFLTETWDLFMGVPLCVLAACPLLPSSCFAESRQPSGLRVSLWSAGKPGSPPWRKQCPCTAGSIGGTAPLFSPSDEGGGVGGNGADAPACFIVGGVCRGPRPAERGQERLCVGLGLGVQVEQVPELGAPWSRTGE